MSLTQAIDALHAYVKDHWRTSDYGDRLPQFNALDTEVYLEACRLGLQDSLPRRDATFHNPKLLFFGRTNVPGTWNIRPDQPVTLTLMNTQGWEADMMILRALAERAPTACTQLPRATTTPPKTLLTGWRDITATLSRKYSQRNEIKSLNKRYGGPIKSRGSGTRPMVYREDLFEWWDKLAVEEQELANRRAGGRLAAQTQYNYGRNGTVAPEVGGSVKQRRKPKQT
jgi:hypothetical protein